MGDLVMRISVFVQRGFICQCCGVEIDRDAVCGARKFTVSPSRRLSSARCSAPWPLAPETTATALSAMLLTLQSQTASIRSTAPDPLA